MRKNIFVLFIPIVSLLCLVLFVFSSFKKNNTLTILNKDYSLSGDYEKDLISPTLAKTYRTSGIQNFSNLYLTNEELNNLVKGVMQSPEINTKIEGTPYIISFYCKNSDDNKISFENIRGLSFWMFNGTNLNHHYYEKKNGILQKSNRLTLSLDYFSFYLLDLLHFYSFKNDDNPENSICYVFRGALNSKSRVYTGIADGGLIKNIILDQEENNAYKVYGQRATNLQKFADDEIGINEGTKKCNKRECEKGIGECRDLSPGDNDPNLSCYDYKSESCRLSTFAENAEQNNMFEINLLNFEKFYNFRDNFLHKTEKGKKYINYYYLISYCINSNGFDLKELKSHFNLLIKINSLIDDFTVGTNNDKIIINDEFANQLLEMISSYETKSDDSNYKQALLQIKNDVEFYKGKTKNEIFKSIGI